MHHALRFRGTRVEDGTGIPQDLKNMSIRRSDVVPPRTVPGTQAEIFHSQMLLDAYGKAVQRTNGSLMFGVEDVEELCACEGSFREELRDAVGLLVRMVERK